MDPRFLMLSERVLMNCLVDLMPYASQTRVSRPQKNWAMVDPSSTAGVSEKMVSVATASLHVGMLKTGLRGWGCPCTKWV